MPGGYLRGRKGLTESNYTWDTRGQLSTKSENSNTCNLIFNGRGHLSGVSEGQSVTEAYIYDALGNRLKVINGSEISTSLMFGNEPKYEIKKDISTGEETKTKYISINGKFLARTTQEGEEGNEEKYFYHVDMVGSVRNITDLSGASVEKYVYEPFGSLISREGIDNDNLGFTGKKLDDTGLSYFSARYYDSEIGRFISRDPARSGRNWFAYCAINPLVYTDPSGLMLPQGKEHLYTDDLIEFDPNLNDYEKCLFYYEYTQTLQNETFEENIGLMLAEGGYHIFVGKEFYDVWEQENSIYHSNGFVYGEKTVYFNLYSILEFKKDDRFLYPIEILNHEVGHAADFIKNPELYLREQGFIKSLEGTGLNGIRELEAAGIFGSDNLGSPSDWIREVSEMRNINLNETPFNQERGMYTRNSYKDNRATEHKDFTKTIPMLKNTPGYEFLNR